MSPLIPKALAVSLAFSLAGLPPARATIVQAEPDTDSDLLAELASHQAGARHKAVAAIHLTDEKGAVRLVSGSGTYIGASRDGRKGLVLTAAHLFGYDPKAPAPLNYGCVLATFCADPDQPRGRVVVAAQRVLVHPGYTATYQARLGPFGNRPSKRRSIRDDIALLEFDLAAHAGDLEAAGIAPALLDDAGGHRGALAREAAFLGFGVYGNNREMLFRDNQRVHLGRTLVTHVEQLGRDVLMNLAPLAEGSPSSHWEADPEFGPHIRFASQASPREALLRTALGSLPLMTHPEHAVPGAGDSGGPLLFQAPDGTPRVAGVASGTMVEKARMGWRGRSPRRWTLASIWEPVGPHRDWIERVRDGMAGGGTPVLEPGDGCWRPACGEEQDTCSLCAIM